MNGSTTTTLAEQRDRVARVVTVALAVWLFVSGFAWPHAQAQFTNTWVVATLCAFAAWEAADRGWVRYLNVILAVWLFFSVWALSGADPRTTWNNILVAVALFIVSIVGAPVGSRSSLAGRHEESTSPIR